MYEETDYRISWIIEIWYRYVHMTIILQGKQGAILQ